MTPLDEPPLTDRSSALDRAQERLSTLNLAQVVHGKRAIIVLEGPEGASKKRVLMQLIGAFDPCRLLVHPTEFDPRSPAQGHWLAPFWTRLPPAGTTAAFFHSWYRRVLDDRLLGRLQAPEWTRAYDEINEFEAQQHDYGTLLIKLYFTVSASLQARRLAERTADPWQRWTVTPEAVRTGPAEPGYAQAFDDLLAQTDTRWAPWTVIDGNVEEAAAIAALEAVAAALTKAVPGEPPAAVEVVE